VRPLGHPGRRHRNLQGYAVHARHHQAHIEFRGREQAAAPVDDPRDAGSLGEDLVGYTAELPRSDQFGLRSLRLARTLEPGFVLTVEPGIYFIPELIRQWQAEGRHLDFINYDRVQDFIDFSGIRIEDNLLITADGYRLLGPPIPKSVEEVEATCSAQ